jgi:RNA polymerase sigma-70 factor (ECF subfamily)
MVAAVSPSVRRFLPSTERAGRAALSRREALHDAGLVRRFNAGDGTAFAEIVTRYRPKMLHIALRLLRNHADAEEIAQDTFIRAHRGLAAFRGESSLASWLHLITLNLSRNRYWYFNRRQRHRTLPLDEMLGVDRTSTLADLIACPGPGPVHAAATQDFHALVAISMSRLSIAQREILQLRSGPEYSYRAIAQQLNIDIGTVKSRLARARKRLRMLLGDVYTGLPRSERNAGSPWFEPHRPGGMAGLARLPA